jgi:hypothetical protein
MCNHHRHHLATTATRLFFAAAVASIVLAPSLAAFAGDVEFKFSGRVVWVGQPFTAEINIINAKSYQPPFLPAIDGVKAKVIPGARESSFTRIVNGRTTTRSTRTIVIEFTPERPGIFEIPPISVTVDGEVYQSRPWRFVAETSEVGDRLLVDVVGVPGEAVVGQPVELKLNIWIEVFRDRDARITLSEGDMWSLVDVARSSWGVFGEAIRDLEQRRQRPRGQEVLRNERTYYVYQISLTEHPVKAGTIDPGAVRIVLQYPESLRREQGLFNRGNLVLDGSRPISLDAHIEPITVLPLPTEGRPRHFTGAVGRYSVRASARPTDAAVGDPITLVLEITDESAQGNAELANLRPPPLRDLAELDGFRIPDDPTTGIVDGRTKVFTETLRPTNQEITELPAIPFSSFDPELGRYVTVRTQPIPLVVSASEHLDLGSILPGLTTSRGPNFGSGLTLVEGNLHANLPLTQALLADQSTPYNSVALAAAVAPPLAVAALALWARRKHVHEARPDLLRAVRARREALRKLASEGDAPDRVFAAVTGLIAARAHLAAGTLTATEATAVAQAHGLDHASVEELRALLASCESSRYAPEAMSDDDLVARARPLLAALDTIRPVEKGGAA